MTAANEFMAEDTELQGNRHKEQIKGTLNYVLLCLNRRDTNMVGIVCEIVGCLPESRCKDGCSEESWQPM